VRTLSVDFHALIPEFRGSFDDLFNCERVPRYQTPPYVMLYRPIFTSAAAARLKFAAPRLPAASAAVCTNRAG